MRIRIKVRPTGLLNGREWLPVGEEMDVPDIVGADMCAAGAAEPVAVKAKAEKRPAATKAEKRG